RWVL
ncbi:hypothetical protein VCHC62B1_3401B, partial [Vibrio cholerae HC-62B1]